MLNNLYKMSMFSSQTSDSIQGLWGTGNEDIFSEVVAEKLNKEVYIEGFKIFIEKSKSHPSSIK